jgi:SAM-dependent methyltransferase
MKPFLRRFHSLLASFGIDPLKMVHSLRALPIYFRNFAELKRQEKSTSPSKFPFGKLYPCLEDRYLESGSAKGHYFHQDLLVARRIHSNGPSVHLDVGSRIDGFVAHVASFRSIVVLDIRPLSSTIPNLRFMQADLMKPVPVELVDFCDSVSCLHAMEHFGLGRYGDSINYDGYLIGLENLHRILKSEGKLYFSVPIGPQRIEFDAHRVFSVRYLIECFSGRYQTDRFSFVDDLGELHEDVALTDADVENNFGCHFGCGILEMTKR